MSSGPRSFNFFTVFLILAFAAAGYGVWKYFPVYFMAWQVDHVLADGGARSYKFCRQTEPGRAQQKQALADDLRAKVMQLGVVDPELTVNVEWVGNAERVEVTADYRAVILHPGGRFTVLPFHRKSSTDLSRPVWD